MSEVVQNAEREFWSPPVVEPPVTVEPISESAMIEVCDRCETEFIPGSRFCHVCGAERVEQSAGRRLLSWMRSTVSWARQLEFQNIERGLAGTRQWIGLPTASLISFAVGLVCLAGAIGVGLVFTVQTTLDWQAVQLWRIEWLLGASAAFLAGILLKKSAN